MTHHIKRIAVITLVLTVIIAGYNLCDCKDPPFPCKENRDQVKHFLYDLRYICNK